MIADNAGNIGNIAKQTNYQITSSRLSSLAEEYTAKSLLAILEEKGVDVRGISREKPSLATVRAKFIEWYLTEGTKPEDGFIYYMKKTGFMSGDDALRFYRSESVDLWVGKICPKT